MPSERTSDGTQCIEGTAEGVIEESMDLWDYIESAVHDTSHDLPTNKDWLPAEVSVEITIQSRAPRTDRAEGGDR